MARSKTTSDAPKCPLCGSDMLTEYGCNLTQMTQRAGWHFEFEPRMKFCHACSDEMLKYIEKWYKSRNVTGVYNKFPTDDIEI